MAPKVAFILIMRLRTRLHVHWSPSICCCVTFLFLLMGSAPSVFAERIVGRNPRPPLRRGLGFNNLSLMTTIGDSSNSGIVPGTPPHSAKPDTSFWDRPTGALFKSIMLPGWGQYSNKKYQKAAIYFGLESYFMFKSVKYFLKTRDRYDTFQETRQRKDFFAYNSARKTRNKYYWFVVGTIFISMWDAYADAHLRPLEETKGNDDFWGLNPADHPRISPPALSLALTIRF